jgi:hypothetical protein
VNDVTSLAFAPNGLLWLAEFTVTETTPLAGQGVGTYGAVFTGNIAQMVP